MSSTDTLAWQLLRSSESAKRGTWYPLDYTPATEHGPQESDSVNLRLRCTWCDVSPYRTGGSLTKLMRPGNDHLDPLVVLLCDECLEGERFEFMLGRTAYNVVRHFNAVRPVCSSMHATRRF